MKCNVTSQSAMVRAGRYYFRTLRNACVTAGKTIMTAGKIYHGCFEMLSRPHRTSANIINICFWLLETCTNIPWAGGLYLGKFPDNRRLMCFSFEWA